MHNGVLKNGPKKCEPTRFSLVKFVSTLLALLLGFEAIAVPLAEAQQFENIWLQRRSALTSTTSLAQPAALPKLQPITFEAGLAPVQIPSQFGRLIQIWSPPVPTSRPLVVLIQDIHEHPATQLNIAGILEALKTQNGARLTVGLEGAWTPLDFAPYQNSAYDEWREMTARAFLEKNYISGAHYFALINRPGDVRLIGLEKKEPYLENLRARDRSKATRERMATVLGFLEKRMDRIGRHLLPLNVQEFMKNRRRYQNGELALADYVRYLLSISPQAPAAINQFVELDRFQQKANTTELAGLREGLVQKIASKAAAPETARLLGAAKAHQEGRLSAASFHRMLLEMAEGQALSVPSALKDYQRYLENEARFSAEEMMEAVDALELAAQKKICAKVSGFKDIERFLTLRNQIHEQQRMWNLELIPRSAKANLQIGQSLKWQEAEAFLAGLERSLGIRPIAGVVPPYYWEAFQDIKRYYQLAGDRNIPIIENLTKIENRQSKMVVLVAGGFHTPGLTSLLEQHQFPHAVVQPSIEPRALPENKVSVIGDLPDAQERLETLSNTLLKAMSLNLPDGPDQMVKKAMENAGEKQTKIFSPKKSAANPKRAPPSAMTRLRIQFLSAWALVADFFAIRMPAYASATGGTIAQGLFKVTVVKAPLKEKAAIAKPAVTPLKDIILTVAFYAALYAVVLPGLHYALGLLIPGAQGSAGATALINGTLWALDVAGNVVVFLAAVRILAERFPSQGIREWHEGWKKDHPRLAIVLHLAMEPAKTVYSFGFKRMDRLLALYRAKRFGGEANLKELTRVEKVYAKLSWPLQLALLPFFAFAGIFADRMTLYFYSTIVSLVLTSMGLDFLQGFNALDIFMGAGWSESFAGMETVAGSAVQLFSAFAFANTILLSFLLFYVGAWKKHRAQGAGILKSLVLPFLDFRYGTTWMQYFRSMFSLHIVGFEIAVLKWASAAIDPIRLFFGEAAHESAILRLFSLHEFVMKIEDNKQGIMGISQNFADAVFTPLGINPSAHPQMRPIAETEKESVKAEKVSPPSLFSMMRAAANVLAVAAMTLQVEGEKEDNRPENEKIAEKHLTAAKHAQVARWRISSAYPEGFKSIVEKDHGFMMQDIRTSTSRNFNSKAELMAFFAQETGNYWQAINTVNKLYESRFLATGGRHFIDRGGERASNYKARTYSYFLADFKTGEIVQRYYDDNVPENLQRHKGVEPFVELPDGKVFARFDHKINLEFDGPKILRAESRVLEGFYYEYEHKPIPKQTFDYIRSRAGTDPKVVIIDKFTEDTQIDSKTVNIVAYEKTPGVYYALYKGGLSQMFNPHAVTGRYEHHPETNKWTRVLMSPHLVSEQGSISRIHAMDNVSSAGMFWGMTYVQRETSQPGRVDTLSEAFLRPKETGDRSFTNADGTWKYPLLKTLYERNLRTDFDRMWLTIRWINDLKASSDESHRAILDRVMENVWVRPDGVPILIAGKQGFEAADAIFRQQMLAGNPDPALREKLKFAIDNKLHEVEARVSEYEHEFEALKRHLQEMKIVIDSTRDPERKARMIENYLEVVRTLSYVDAEGRHHALIPGLKEAQDKYQKLKATGQDKKGAALNLFNEIQFAMKNAPLLLTGAVMTDQAPTDQTAAESVHIQRDGNNNAVLNVHGRLWSGAPGFAYQPETGRHVSDYERGNLRYLYRALLPPNGQGIDPQKYPDLIRLAQDKNHPNILPQDDARKLKESGAKFIRTYNLAGTSPEDLKVVAQIFDWMYQSHGLMFTAGMHDPRPQDMTKLAGILGKHPGLLLYDGWNEIDLLVDKNFAAIDQIAGVLKANDPNHPVAIVVSQSLDEKEASAIKAMKNIDIVGVTIYNRDGQNAAQYIQTLQKEFAPKAVIVSEIGIPVNPQYPALRAQQLGDIATALTTTNPMRPGPAPLFTWFEFSPEKWKLGDNKWWFEPQDIAAVRPAQTAWKEGQAAPLVPRSPAPVIEHQLIPNEINLDDILGGKTLPRSAVEKSKNYEPLFNGQRDRAGNTWVRVKQGKLPPYIEIYDYAGDKKAVLRGRDLVINGDDITKATVSGDIRYSRFAKNPQAGIAQVTEEFSVPKINNYPLFHLTQALEQHIAKHNVPADVTRELLPFDPSDPTHRSIVVTRKTGERTTEIFNNPSEADPEFAITKVGFFSGYVEMKGEPVINPVSGELVYPQVEQYQDGQHKGRRLLEKLDETTGRATYRVQTLGKGEKVLREKIEVYEADGPIAIRIEDKGNQSERIYFDVERARKIKTRTGFEVEIPHYMTRADDNSPNEWGGLGQPVVVYDVQHDDIGDHNLTNMRVISVNLAKTYSNTFDTAPLPAGVKELADRFKGQTAPGRLPEWKIMRLERMALGADPWGGAASLFRPVEVEDRRELIVTEYEPTVVFGQTMGGKELRRMHYGKTREGGFFTPEERSEPTAAPTAVPTAVGELRHKTSLPSNAVASAIGNVDGKVDPETNLLPIVYTNSAGMQRRVYEDALGRAAMQDELDPAKPGDTSAWIQRSISSDWIYSVVNQKWTARNVETLDRVGAVKESKMMGDPDSRTGATTFQETNLISKVAVITKIDADGNPMEARDTSVGRLVIYDAEEEDIAFRLTGIQAPIPKETYSLLLNGEIDELVWRHQFGGIDFINGKITFSFTRQHQLFKNQQVAEIFEGGPYVQWWGDRVLNRMGVRPASDVFSKTGSMERRTYYYYTDAGVQFRSASLFFGVDGELNLDATQSSDVVLNADGKPVLDDVQLKGIPNYPTQKAARVTVSNSLGEVYVENINARGHAIRRFVGSWQGGQFVPAQKGIDDLVTPSKWEGGSFVPETVNEMFYTDRGQQPIIDQYQARLEKPVPHRGSAFRVNPDGSYGNRPYENGTTVGVRADPQTGEYEFISRHEELVYPENEPAVVNRIWQDEKRVEGTVRSHYEGALINNQFIPRLEIEYEYDSIYPNTPIKSKAYIWSPDGKSRARLISESETIKDRPLRKPFENIFESFDTKLPVSVVISQGQDFGQNTVWQEVRDMQGRLRVYVEGKIVEGKFEPDMRYLWRYDAAAGQHLPKHVLETISPITPFKVEIDYEKDKFVESEEAVDISVGLFVGHEKLPVGKGLSGQYGSVFQTDNSFIGARIQETRDALGKIAVRKDGFVKENDSFFVERTAYYDYSKNQEKGVPDKIAASIDIQENGKTVRALEFDRIEDGYIVYRVTFDDLEHGLEYVGYGTAGMSWEDHVYREIPNTVRIYHRQAIPIYSTTEDFQGQKSLYKIYDVYVVREPSVNNPEKKDTYVVVVQREPRNDEAVRGVLGDTRSFFYRLLDLENNPLRGPIWGVIKNGQVIYREEGIHKIVRNKLTTWDIADHYIASPIGRWIRSLDPWAQDVRPIAFGEKIVPGTEVQKIDSLQFVERELKDRSIPGSVAAANRGEILQFLTTYMVPIIVTFGFFVLSFVFYKRKIASWWRRNGPININQADKGSIEALFDFTPQDANTILMERREKIVFQDWDDLLDSVGDNQRLRDILEKNRDNITFSQPGSWVYAPERVLGDEDIASLTQVSSVSPSHVLYRVAPSIRNLMDRGFISHAEVAAILSRYANRLLPGTLSRDQVAGRILADLVRKAYWREIPGHGYALKNVVRRAMMDEALRLMQAAGYPLTGENRAYMEKVMANELAGQAFSAEFLYFDPVINADAKLLAIPINDRGTWKFKSLREEVLRKLIRRAIPFISTQAPYETYLVNRFTRLQKRGRGQEARDLWEFHRRFLYALEGRELEKHEDMRDIRTGVTRDYAFTWEEFSDLFRYMQGRSEWGLLPETLQADPVLRQRIHAAEKELNRLKPGNAAVEALLAQSNKAFGTSKPGDSANNYPLDAVSVHLIRHVFEPLIKQVRGGLGTREYDQDPTTQDPAGLGIPKIERPQNQATVTMRSINLMLSIPTYFQRFLGNTQVGANLKAELSSYFYRQTFLSTAMFLLFLASFAVANFWLMPVPADLDLGFISFALPRWVRVVISIAAIAPMFDAIILTYFSVANLGKAMVAYYTGRKYDIAHAKTWGQTRKALVEKLNGPENALNRIEFGLFLDKISAAPWSTTAEVAAWRKALTKANRGTLTIADIPEKLHVEKTMQRVKNWVNKKYRLDSPLAPTQYDQLKSFTFQISAWAEAFWFSWETLLKVEPGALEHRLGMAARAYKDQWEVLIEDLEEQGKVNADQKKALLSLSKNPKEGIPGTLIAGNSELADILTEWTNDTLGTGYHQLKGALEAREVYRHYIKRFFPHAGEKDVERMVNEKLQYTYKHDDVANNLSGRLNSIGGLEVVLANLRNNSQTVPQIIAYLNTNLDRTPDSGGKTLPAAFATVEEVAFYLKFLADKNIELHWWKKNQTDIHIQAKYIQWANMFPHVRGEILISLDADHEFLWEETFMLPNVGMDFEADPKLAIAPFKSYIFTKPLSNTAKAMGMAEEGWLAHEQRVKGEVGALAFYGKGFIRTQFLRDLEGLQDDYVAEDFETAARFMTFGLHSKHINYLAIGKALPNDFGTAISPLRKWAGDTTEMLTGANPMKFFLAPNVHWTKKWDSLNSAAFYLKKPRVVRYITYLAFLHYAFPFNPLTGLPLIFYAGAVILGQAISYGALFNRWDEKGYFKGTLLFFFVDMPFTLAPFYMGLLPHYDDSVGRGFGLYAKFIATIGKGGTNKRATFREVWISNNYGIRKGVFVMLFTVLLSPFDPSRSVIWVFVLGTVVYGWVMAPFIFNPDKPSGKLVDQFLVGNVLVTGVAYSIYLFLLMIYPPEVLSTFWVANLGFSVAFLIWKAFTTPRALFTTDLFWALRDNNFVFILGGILFGLIDLPMNILLRAMTVLNTLTRGRYPFLHWGPKSIWSRLKAYNAVGQLDGNIKGEINNFATNHFSGVKAYAEGRLVGNASFTYLVLMEILAQRAKRDLKKKKIKLPDPAVIEDVYEDHPHWSLEVISSLPMVDWLLLLIPLRPEFPGPLAKVADQITSIENNIQTPLLSPRLWGLYALFIVLYAAYLPVYSLMFVRRLATRVKEVFAYRETVLSDRAAEQRLASVAELEFEALNYPEQLGYDAIISELEAYRGDESPVVSKRAFSALRTIRRLAQGIAPAFLAFIAWGMMDSIVQAGWNGGAATSHAWLLAVPLVLLAAVFSGGAGLLFDSRKDQLATEPLSENAMPSLNIPGEASAGLAPILAIQPVVTKSLPKIVETIRDRWVARMPKEGQLPVVHLIYISTLEDLAQKRDEIEAARYLSLERPISIVIAAPRSIHMSVQETFQDIVIPFDGDGNALLASIARSMYQKMNGQRFDFIVDSPAIEAELRQAITPALLSELEAEKLIQFRRANPADPNGYLRVLLEYYFGDEAMGIFAQFKEHTVGKSLIKQLLVMRQA